MVKKLVLMIVLLTTTALTVVFGEGFDINIFNQDPTEVVSQTATISPTQSLEATATSLMTETAVPTTTSQFTSTPTATELVESTATNTATATSTPTQQTNTATPTNTPTSTNTPTPTPAVISGLFSVQSGSPVFMTNFVHSAEGCAWQGIAGQVFDADGLPIVGYVVRVVGTFNNVAIDLIGLTGLVTNQPYGPGSYEFVLGNVALDTENQLTIQLFSPDGVEATSPMTFNTYSSCSKNLEILNFQHN